MMILNPFSFNEFNVSITGRLGWSSFMFLESKKDGIKWIRTVNNYRNTVAHVGAKSYGLNREELDFLKTIFNTIN
tara:strand:- start:2918 stop:3142 length:225 start_codon:yes stop_codon:yes gene_type:complete